MQEGIIGTCPGCDGLGQRPRPFRDDPLVECTQCNGDGIARINHDIDVILVGDIGHFGKGGSPTGDLLTWMAAVAWADVILWGNHDRALVEPQHHHAGFQSGMIETDHIVKLAIHERKVVLAATRHGFLITHAGLHSAFRNQPVENNIKTDLGRFVEWINQVNGVDSTGEPSQMAIRDAIPRRRGGFAPAGGILWRDINEKLYPGFRQIFGHSADHNEHKVRYCWENMYSRVEFPDLEPPVGYCIDIGGRGDVPSENCLAGIYLPEERIVTWHG